MRVALALFLVAQVAIAQLATLPLTGVASDSTFSTSISATYGYLSPAKALFLNVTVLTNGSYGSAAPSIGYLEVDLKMNSTHAQAFQFSVTPTGLCALQALVNLDNSSDSRVGQNPSHLNVTSLTRPTLNSLSVAFQIWPFDASVANAGGVPSLMFNVGPPTNSTNSFPQCSAYLKFNVLMIGQPISAFTPFASNDVIAAASSGCVYGSPYGAAPFGCQSCFSPYYGATCNLTSGVLNTTVAPSNLTMAPSNSTMAPTMKQIITLTLNLDIAAFDGVAFASAVATLMSISSTGVILIQYYAGSVVVIFYFSDAVTAAYPTIAQSFVDMTNQTNAFTAKYPVLSARISVGEATTTAPLTTAAVTDGHGDSGFTQGQIAVLIIVIVVIVIIIVVAIVVYVKRSKDGTPQQGRSSAYGNDAQTQQMTAIGATAQSQKPGGKTAPAANKPSYDI